MSLIDDNNAISGSDACSHDYFDSFRSTGFTPNPRSGIEAEFKRLAKHLNWSRKECGYEREQAYSDTFHLYWGDRAQRLEDWKAFCVELDIYPIPASITKCQKVRVSYESRNLF
jgi:hypothetical protein